ncbi:MAG: CotH kinase family protein [Muribaculaceae bacterium]|nr:CotH kinase family protein [Muribaculaceae bacterium]
MKKHLLFTMALMLMGATSWAQSLNIGGHRAVLDSLNNIWLCSVPQSYFGNDFEAQVTFGDELTSLVIDTIEVASGDTITFAGIEGGKNYLVTVIDSVGDTISRNITFTWLPIVELNGTFGNSYSEASVTVNEPDSAYAEPMRAKAKWRGGATNLPGKHKRNYRIKFLDEDSMKMDRRFFGLRKDNSWILDAAQMDFLRVRNRVGADLWLDMARRPWYTDTLPNAHNGSRGQMVEVLLNGKYAGLYNMCEPIDRKQMKLKRYDEENQEFHGQLWMSYKWTRTVAMSAPAAVSPNSVTWDGFEAKYPDPDEVNAVNWNVLKNAAHFATRADRDMKLRRDSTSYYFDLPIMQDYYIFIVTLQALDNESKNIYWACYDTQTNPRLTMVPWDLDICLGANYSPTVNIPDMISPEREANWVSLLPMADMLEVKEYYIDMVNRYRELRETILDTDSLVNRYRSAIDNLENCGAAAREESRWSGDSDLANKTLDLSAEMDYVENWIRRHMAYLDENVFVDWKDAIKGDVNGDGEVNIADVNALIDIILGGPADGATQVRADVNEDGEINIADVNALIDIILSA